MLGEKVFLGCGGRECLGIVVLPRGLGWVMGGKEARSLQLCCGSGPAPYVPCPAPHVAGSLRRRSPPPPSALRAPAPSTPP